MKIKFFASLKEQLDCEELDWPLPDQASTIEDVIDYLSTRGENWAKVFQNSKLMVAINQEMANKSSTVSDNDEVAFFPPVTGG